METLRALTVTLLAGAALLGGASPLSAQWGAPGRVASANVCADQLLVALLGAPATIALSRLSRDEDVSFFADRAGAFPVTGGTGEELVRLQPDLVLLGRFDSPYTRRVLAGRGIPFLLVDGWDSVPKLNAGLKLVGARLRRAERSEAIIKEVAEALAALESVGARVNKRYSFLVLQRRGYVIHEGLLPSVLESGGLRNGSADVGLKGSGLADLERIVKGRPDFLIVDARSEDPVDQGAALLQHPALASLWPPERRLVVPDVLSVCGGPSTPALIDVVREQIEHKVLPLLD